MYKNILIVEDEIIIATLLRKILESEGYKITGIVTSGEKAVDMVSDKDIDIDIVIMDIHLSGNIDGIEAARRIKENKNIQIVFMTGYPDQETKDLAFKTQPAGFFIKPLDINNFIMFIKKLS